MRCVNADAESMNAVSIGNWTIALLSLMIGVAAYSSVQAQSLPTYRMGDPGPTGGIIGQVRFEGPPPVGRILRIVTDDGACEEGFRDPNPMVMRHSGELSGVVVEVSSVSTGMPWSAEFDVTRAFTRNCRFEPFMQIARAGVGLQLANLDEVPFGIDISKTDSNGTDTIETGIELLVFGEVFREYNFPAGSAISLASKQFPWMLSWIYVANNPYTSVSDIDGYYELIDVPAGKHILSIWHPVLGFFSEEVDVPVGDTVRKEIILSYR